MKTVLTVQVVCAGEDYVIEHDNSKCEYAMDFIVNGGATTPERTDPLDIAFARGVIRERALAAGWVPHKSGQVALCPVCNAQYVKEHR